MSGVFGLAGGADHQSVPAAVDAMATRMSHRSWHAHHAWCDPSLPVAIGRLGIGIFNRAPQPARSADGTVAAVFAGVLFNAAAAHDGLPRGDDGTAPAGDADLILRLYAAYGARFPGHLNGEYVAAVWDRSRQALWIVNDRLGLYPTYYAHQDGRFAFAPEMKAILGLSGFRKQLDATAMAEYMRFQVVLGERTFFDDVLLLPPATVLRYDLRSDALDVTRYWSFAEIPAVPAISPDDAVNECGRLLGRALNRMPEHGYRPALYLTGGIDARLLLGLFDPRDSPVTTLTFGQRGSADVVYAERLARRMGCAHHWFPLESGAWVRSNADLHLALTEGFHGWIHAHGISTLPALRELAPIATTGWEGTTVGAWLNKFPLSHLVSDDLDVMAVRQFHLFNQVFTWPGLGEAEERALYAHTWDTALAGRAFDSLRTALAPYMSYRPDVRAEHFYLRNHTFRMTQHFITMLRSHVEVYSPFFDIDLLHFVYSLPSAVRGYKLLQRAMLQRFAPQLCTVPYARDGFLLTTNERRRTAHMWATKLRRKINAHVAPLFPEPATLYADYGHYVRTDLRDWAHDLLLGARTLDRGFYRPVFLRSLWERMQSGKEPDMIGKLSPIMTYELMLRALVDP